MGPQGDRHCRDRNARSHGHPRGVCRVKAPHRGPHRRIAPHDDPDRGPYRDAQGARCRCPMGELQHLQHPGPRCGRDRRCRHPRLRVQGRDPRRVLAVHPPHPRVERWRHSEHDSRRRRRRHAPRPPRLQGRKRSERSHQPDERRRDCLVQLDQSQARGGLQLLQPGQGEHQGRQRRDDDRRSPSLRAAEEG